MGSIVSGTLNPHNGHTDAALLACLMANPKYEPVPWVIAMDWLADILAGGIALLDTDYRAHISYMRNHVTTVRAIGASAADARNVGHPAIRRTAHILHMLITDLIDSDMQPANRSGIALELWYATQGMHRHTLSDRPARYRGTT